MIDIVCRDVFRGTVLALQVLDRDGARTFTHQERYAVISITDPPFKHPVLAQSEFRRSVLQLTFSDVDERAARLKMRSRHIVAFATEMATQIAHFIHQQIGNGTLLFVVHCEAGMSRSAGVAAAISKFYNEDETFFLRHYRPNLWVRHLLLEAMESSFHSGLTS